MLYQMVTPCVMVCNEASKDCLNNSRYKSNWLI